MVMPMTGTANTLDEGEYKAPGPDLYARAEAERPGSDERNAGGFFQALHRRFLGAPSDHPCIHNHE